MIKRGRPSCNLTHSFNKIISVFREIVILLVIWELIMCLTSLGSRTIIVRNIPISFAFLFYKKTSVKRSPQASYTVDYLPQPFVVKHFL